MMFNRVIEYVFDKEFNLKQKVFTDHLGFSQKSARNYFKSGLKKGRMLNQFISRLKSIKGSTKSNIAKYLSSELINVFEFFSDGKGNVDKSFISGFVDGYCFGVAEECRELGVEPAELLNALPSVFYSMHFIDAVNLPFRRGDFNITRENFDSLDFPYSKLSKPDALKYFSIQSLEDRPELEDAGLEIHRLLKESFSSVVASLSLDTERLSSSELEGDSNFLANAWDEGNIVAQYFCWLRDNSGFDTQVEFYNFLAKSFPNIDADSVKTNYKRWCETGRLDNRQLLKLSGAMAHNHDGEVFFLTQYLIAVLLQLMKEVLEECSIEYPYESFRLDVNKWRGWIKAEYPLENWQPTKAANTITSL